MVAFFKLPDPNRFSMMFSHRGEGRRWSERWRMPKTKRDADREAWVWGPCGPGFGP